LLLRQAQEVDVRSGFSFPQCTSAYGVLLRRRRVNRPEFGPLFPSLLAAGLGIAALILYAQVKRDDRATLALVIDCQTRELLGWEPDFYNGP
jgi:hypothetical protein